MYKVGQRSVITLISNHRRRGVLYPCIAPRAVCSMIASHPIIAAPSRPKTVLSDSHVCTLTQREASHCHFRENCIVYLVSLWLWPRAATDVIQLILTRLQGKTLTWKARMMCVLKKTTKIICSENSRTNPSEYEWNSIVRADKASCWSFLHSVRRTVNTNAELTI